MNNMVVEDLNILEVTFHYTSETLVHSVHLKVYSLMRDFVFVINCGYNQRNKILSS